MVFEEEYGELSREIPSSLNITQTAVARAAGEHGYSRRGVTRSRVLGIHLGAVVKAGGTLQKSNDRFGSTPAAHREILSVSIHGETPKVVSRTLPHANPNRPGGDFVIGVYLAARNRLLTLPVTLQELHQQCSFFTSAVALASVSLISSSHRFLIVSQSWTYQ